MIHIPFKTINENLFYERAKGAYKTINPVRLKGKEVKSVVSGCYFPRNPSDPSKDLLLRMASKIPETINENSNILLVNDMGLQWVKYLYEKYNIKKFIILCVSNGYASEKAIKNILTHDVTRLWDMEDIKVTPVYFDEVKDKMFDLVIVNPPYTLGLANPIIRNLPKLAKAGVLLFPESLSSSLGKGLPESRDALAPTLNNIEYWGTEFDDASLPTPLCIYSFGTSSNHYSFEGYLNGRRSDIELSIRKKCSEAGEKFHYEWMRENVKTKENCEKLLSEGTPLINCSCYGRNNAEGIMMKKPHSYCASYLGPKELIENFKNPIYKQLALMFSTNKRDQQAKIISNLPINLPSFSEEELKWLSDLEKVLN